MGGSERRRRVCTQARCDDYGATRFELSTDSRTGALPLYERVGMVAESVWVNRALDLEPTTENAV